MVLKIGAILDKEDLQTQNTGHHWMLLNVYPVIRLSYTLYGKQCYEKKN